ncbi:MAG: PEGA domain-containing protein, partial [Deltaproteobacteria bacterium]
IGSFERHVVLKMILPERAHDETSVQMFLDEARLAASLNHQNVAQVFEVGKDASIHFLAMEYVHGQDLRALLARAGSAGTRVPLELALTVVSGAAAGLEHAHERRSADGTPMGIVHRDVSPSNIMIGYDGSVKLLDFGIAKATSRSVETQSGVIKGKFAYMAPEQCRGREVDRRSDVFSLGIILYEVTTQHRCFRADSDFDTMHRIVTGDIVRPTRLVHGYPQALEAIVLKALAVEPGQRYQSAGLLLEAVESFAIAARMSLSTMALGRFMRDMFGDVPEPWLAPGRLMPAQAKEQTISSTNASSDHPRARSASAPPPQRPSAPSASSAGVPWPSAPSGSAVGAPWMSPGSGSSPLAQRPPGSGSAPAIQRPSSPSSPPPVGPFSPPLGLSSAHEQAPLHLPPDALDLPPDALDLPPDAFDRPPEAAAPAPPDWSAQPLPPPPGYAPAAGPLLEARPAVAAPPLAIASTLGGPAPGPAAAIPPPPRHSFSDHRSESGMAHVAPGQPIVQTRPGYANAPTMTRSEPYPRGEAQELDLDISLQPSRRLLYLGISIVVIGIVVLLAYSFTERPDEASPPATAIPSQSPDGASSVSAQSGIADPGPVTPPPVKPESVPREPQSGADTSPPRHDTIHLHVVTTPGGAEVSLSGKLLGATPLDTEIERRRGAEILTIHRTRYQDVVATIDLGTDYTQTVTLAPIPEPAPPRPPVEHTTRPPDHTVRTVPHERSGNHDGKRPTKDDDCQPPDKFNPYELACHGHVCKPCPVPMP